MEYGSSEFFFCDRFLWECNWEIRVLIESVGFYGCIGTGMCFIWILFRTWFGCGIALDWMVGWWVVMMEMVGLRRKLLDVGVEVSVTSCGGNGKL